LLDSLHGDRAAQPTVAAASRVSWGSGVPVGDGRWRQGGCPLPEESGPPGVPDRPVVLLGATTSWAAQYSNGIRSRTLQDAWCA